MELRQLRYLVSIAEHGSVSGAARALYVAQSALSHQLAQLEDHLNAPLFHRVPTGMVLTEAGHVFLAHAIAILRQVEEARTSVHGSPARPRGKVNVGLPPSLCNALAPPLLHAVRQDLPGIDLELTEAATGDLADQLRAGIVNLAVLFDDGELIQFLNRPLADERLFLIAKPGTDLDLEASVSFKEVLKLPLFLASPKQGVRRIVEKAAQEYGFRSPNVVAEVNSVSIMRATLLIESGYTVLPFMAVKQELDAGTLRCWPIHHPNLTRRVVLCVSKSISITPATLAVFELIAAVARNLCGTSKWPETKTVSGT